MLIKNPKWIIEDGELIIGKVAFHKDLALDKTKVKGGGWFSFDSKKNTFYLYASSEDFGYAKLEDVKNAVESGKVGERNRFWRYKNFNYQFSEKDSIDEAKNSPHIFTPGEQTNEV